MTTPSKSKPISGIVAKIERHKNAIAKHRDALRDIASDLEEIIESSDTGVSELENAITSLSQYV